MKNGDAKEAEKPTERFSMGPWTIDPLAREVSGPSGTRRLEPKPFALLLHFAANPGRVVSRQELLATAWNEEMATDDVLSRSISELRRALGDDPRAPAFVETIRGTGYRLVVPDLSGIVPASSEHPHGPPTAQSPIARMAHAYPVFLRAGVVVLLAILATWFALRTRAGSVRSVDPHLVPLTTERGEASSPRLSPDGTRIAYVWSEAPDQLTHLVVQSLDGGNRVEVATGTARAVAWSPDGSRLAFVGADANGSFLGIIPGLGGTLRVLTRVSQPPVLGIDWAPDGRTIALATHAEPFEAFRIVLISTDSAATRQLTTAGNASVGDAFPSFSPDGRTLAFARFATETASDVFTVDIASGVEKRLTTDERNIVALSYAADGRAVVHATNRDGGSALWTVSTQGGQMERLVGSDHTITGLSTSRLTEQLIVAAGDPSQQLWTAAPLSGSGSKRVLMQSTRSDGLPSMSPSGDRVAFISDRAGGRDVWLSTVRGDSVVRLTNAGGYSSTPDWSPDGLRLVVQRQASSEAELWTIDITSGRANRLSTGVLNPIAPSWSRDGQSIVAAARRDGSWQLWRIARDSATPTQLTLHGGIRGFESQDGSHLLFTKPDAAGVWSLDLGSKQEHLVVPGVLAGDWTNWAVGGENVFYVDRDASGTQRISAMSLATGAIRVIIAPVHIPTGTGGIASSPDGRRLVFSQTDRRDATLYSLRLR